MGIRDFSPPTCGTRQGDLGFGLDEATFSRYLSTRYDSIAALTGDIDTLIQLAIDLQDFLDQINGGAPNQVIIQNLTEVLTNWPSIYQSLETTSTFPSLAGRAGHYLTTDGSTVMWKDVYPELTGVAVDSALSTAEGAIQSFTMTNSTGFSVELLEGESMTLHLNGGGDGGFAATWTGTIYWVGGDVPVLQGNDIIIFWKLSGNTYGSYAGSVALAPLDPEAVPPVIDAPVGPVLVPAGIIGSYSWENVASVAAPAIPIEGNEGETWAVFVFTGGSGEAASVPPAPVVNGTTLLQRVVSDTTYDNAGAVVAIWASPVNISIAAEVSFTPWQSSYGANRSALFLVTGIASFEVPTVVIGEGDKLASIVGNDAVDSFNVIGTALAKWNSKYADINGNQEHDFGNIGASDHVMTANTEYSLTLVQAAAFLSLPFTA